MNVSKLTGAELDYWAARAEGLTHEQASSWPARNYSTEWAFAGPIIERERITIATVGRTNPKWFSEIMKEGMDTGVEVGYGRHQMSGPTPLVAAMRTFVASKIGPEVPDVK